MGMTRRHGERYGLGSQYGRMTPLRHFNRCHRGHMVGEEMIQAVPVSWSSGVGSTITPTFREEVEITFAALVSGIEGTDS
jgi:hypothetical protein